MQKEMNDMFTHAQDELKKESEQAQEIIKDTAQRLSEMKKKKQKVESLKNNNEQRKDTHVVK